MEIINVKEMTKQEVINAFAKREGDTGSPEVQIALLTQRILQLNDSQSTKTTSIREEDFCRWSVKEEAC